MAKNMSFPPYLLSRMVDLQATLPKVQLKLTRVGVKNLTIALKVVGESGTISLFSTIEAYVDLPSTKRGVHLSRDPETLYEVLEESKDFKVQYVEDFCETLVRKLLTKHDYATRAEINLTSTYTVPRQAPGQTVVTQEPFEILATATAIRNETGDVSVSRAIGVKIVGFTACPCTQELLKTLSRDRLEKMGYKESEVSKILDVLPGTSHTQRTTGFALLTVPAGCHINVEDLATIVEESMSGQTYAILKRPAEASIIERAHRRAMFTEDVVREALSSLSSRYNDLPDSVGVFVQMHSNESVHKHDVIAERTTTLGEIRDEMKRANSR